MTTPRRAVVRVPASSANLGPGYDCLAAALSLHLELEVEEAGEFSVESNLDGVALDRSNLCVQAFERLHSADGLAFRIASQIPLAAGLGSSAAAIVAGLAAANELYGLAADIYPHAVAIEGHPDNVAAALHGGVVICTPARARRIEPPPGLEGVIAIPPDPVSTRDARAALPVTVPVAEAVHNVAHASLLVLGLANDDHSLIGAGLSDRLHQDRRAHLYPRSMELVKQAAELGAIGATISGAGPTVLFWCHREQAGNVLDAIRAQAADCETRRVGFEPSGVHATAFA